MGERQIQRQASPETTGDTFIKEVAAISKGYGVIVGDDGADPREVVVLLPADMADALLTEIKAISKERGISIEGIDEALDGALEQDAGQIKEAERG